MPEPKHVAFLLPDIGGGGAERLTIDLMAGMVRRGARVDLLLQRFSGEFMHLVPPEVRRIDLAAPRIRDAFSPLRRYLAEDRPDTLIAAMWPFTVIALMARRLARSPTRIVVADHCSLRSQYAASGLTYAALRASIRALYPSADRIVGVSRGVAEEVADLAGLKADAVKVVYNPVPPPLTSGHEADRQAGDHLWQGLDGKRILSIGRLKAQKNHGLLLDAFARLAERENAVLAIVGVGELQAELAARVRQLGLADRVIMPGFSATPGDWYASADLFVLPSDYEGFGNVLVEALHCGLPVVSTDCPHGPSEVLGDGQWGRLVPPGDAAALADAMRAALHQTVDPQDQRNRAAEFSVTRAVDAYWDLAFAE